MENQQLAIEVVRQYLEHEFPGRDVADFRDKAYHGHTFRVDDETGTRVAGLTLPTAIVDELHEADPAGFVDGLRDHAQPTARGGRAPDRGAVEASHPDQGRIQGCLSVATPSGQVGASVCREGRSGPDSAVSPF